MTSRIFLRLSACAVVAVAVASGAVASGAVIPPDAFAGPSGVPVSDLSGATRQRAATVAASVVAGHPGYLHAGPDDAFVQQPAQSSLGWQYIPYERTYRHIPVIGGDFVMVVNPAGRVSSASVAQKQAIKDLPTTPKLGQAEAEKIAKSRLKSGSTVEGNRLVVYALGTAPRLAWESTVDGVGPNGDSLLTVDVDALTGAVLDTQEHVLHGTGTSFFNGPNPVSIATSLSNGKYTMVDPTIKNLRCQDYDTGKIFSKSTDTWGNGDPANKETGCVDAMFAAQTEAKMLWQWLGRNGMDGNGGAWPIRMGMNDIGAEFRNGNEVDIGHDYSDTPQLMSQIDVVAHEFGHGIDHTTPGDFSRKNTAEFIADAFGAATEWFANEPPPYDTPDFNTADNLEISRRYMSFSTFWSNYSCYSGEVDTAADDGGHATAGPGDHWFYLLAEGTNPTDGQPVSPSCNATTMTGVGVKQAIQVLYNAMLMKTSDSSYPAYRAWTLTAARNLYPGNCTLYSRVKAAWDAVSVPAGPGEPDDCRPIVYGWGLNDADQVGDEAWQPGDDGLGQHAPAPVFGLATDVTQVAGGDKFSVALHTDGTVWTWGDNSSGQLGDGSTVAYRPGPGPVPGLAGITQISAHGGFALAVASDGSLWAWGDNTYGQLGTGGNLASGDGMRRTPVRVPGTHPVAQAAAGSNFTLTVRTNGEVWAWGNNAYGQLGDKTHTDRLTPVRSSAPYGIVGVAAGRLHGMALRNDGSVWAWGYNGQGQLGDGTTVASTSTAVRVDRHVAGITHIATGEYHSMALGADGTVWTWGDNAYGELGNGTALNQNLPVHLTLTGVTQIDAGNGDSLAVRSDGTLWIWGDNGDGQMGDFTAGGYRTVPRQVQGMADVARASASWYTVLAIAAPHPVVVPDLTDDTVFQAAATLREIGLTVAQPVEYTIDHQCNHINTVINQSPAANTVVFTGSAVHIVIGTLPKTPCS